jgi:Skp family chaperone for outer membrane proteins
VSRRISIIVVLGAVAITAAFTSTANAQAKPPTLKIGTFDSRAVALAFWRSEKGMARTTDMRKKYEQAKTDNDTKLMKQLEIEGPGLQVRMHQQVFSTGSVTDIIAKIKTAIPPIAKEAGVSLVVAKTQIAYKDPSVEYVDITAQLVKLFSPSDEVLKIIEQMSKKEPVPIDKLSMDPKI